MMGTAIRKYGIYAAIAGAYLFAAWWMSPFFDLTRNPAFNSDSALVLTAATEHVPLRENLFQWGAARNGWPLAMAGKAFFKCFGPQHLLTFIAITNTLLFTIGCTVFVPAKISGRNSFLPIPAALLIVLPNFWTGFTWTSFAVTVTDIAHRPEAVPILLVLSWTMMSVGDYDRWTRKWCVRIVGAVILGITGAWVTELALVATLMFAIIAIVGAWVRRLRLPWESLAVWPCTVIGLQILRAISAYGATENRQLYKLVDRETFQRLLGTAVVNLFSNLTPITWLVILLCLGSVAVLVVLRPKIGRPWVYSRLPWHCVSILGLGIAALILPFGNNWVFGNDVLPRYFSAGALLLCVGVFQAGLFFLQQPMPARWKWPLTIGAIVVLLLPAFTTGKQTLQVRRELYDQSLVFRASTMIAESGARAVLGPFWDSYVYVIANPGSIKAAATTDVKGSPTNTLRVLGTSPVAWVDRDPARLSAVMSCRGVEFGQITEAAPVALPTNAYFRLYVPTGNVRIECGLAEYQVYFTYGWLRTENSENYPRLWAIQKTAALSVPLQKQLSYRLDLSAVTPNLEHPQKITVKSQGVSVGSVSSDSDGRLAGTFILPPTGQAGPRSIEFEFAEAFSPVPGPDGNARQPLFAAVERLSFSVVR